MHAHLQLKCARCYFMRYPTKNNLRITRLHAYAVPPKKC